MLYELRHYDTQGDIAMDRLIKRFSSDTLRIWERIGIEPVGFWTVIIGAQSPRLTYILAWESLAQRETLWGQFVKDPEWLAAKAKSIADAGADPVKTVTNTILSPCPSARLPLKNNQPARLEGGVFELRTFAFSESSHLEYVIDWFTTQGQPLMERHGAYIMGTWTTVIGVAPRLTQMLVFENLAHRERAWAAFFTDPQWLVIQADLYESGRSLIVGTESCVMKGTEFAGWR